MRLAIMAPVADTQEDVAVAHELFVPVGRRRPTERERHDVRPVGVHEDGLGARGRGLDDHAVAHVEPGQGDLLGGGIDGHIGPGR